MARRSTPTPFHASSGDRKISELQERTSLLLTDTMTLVAGGLNYRSPLSALLELLFGQMEVVLGPDSWHFYNTPGANVWTKPVSAKYYGSFAAVVGPGGPGGGVTGNGTNAAVGAGGGGGGVALGYYATADLGTTETMTVSATSPGPIDGTAPGAQGAPTAFTTNAATLQATGGNAGGSAIAAAVFALEPGGQGGVGSGSPLGSWANLRGVAGGFSLYNSAATDGVSGFGGGAPLLGGSALGHAPAAATPTPGTNGVNPGQGGSGGAIKGASSEIAKGGDGQGGFGVVIDLYSAIG